LAHISLRAGKHDHVAVRIAKPHLTMLRVRIHARTVDDVGVKPAGPLDCSVKVVSLKPQQHSVAVEGRIRVAEVGMLVRVPGVELKNQLAISNESLILGTSVCALAIQ
jgi:hypothetical protein